MSLPMSLSHAQTTELKEELHRLGERFAKRYNLDHGKVRLELGFIAAHYAAQVGVLDKHYEEMVDARQPTAEPAATSDATSGGPPDHSLSNGAGAGSRG